MNDRTRKRNHGKFYQEQMMLWRAKKLVLTNENYVPRNLDVDGSTRIKTI